ncbi:WecB/TagA/CpsF family glycosyltransferase [Pelomonas sp. APW6]|uniref:WecB/TagA/CpsF family glycosyltransferase n=1 Tax=Roseateles subflavus TaxID=3053353 RepID=A0ABT7LL41_9BURK|nr:WecB/TagA/CpsF family glycosyltransferase [Pelomonas sp. APW6]MDL5032967.1 WecB/TagA/CpsF family glycosyltransferase [Pelomonas sp. APW6]
MPPSRPPPLQETQLFGIRLCAGTLRAAVDQVLDLARRGQGGTVCAANVDMLTQARRAPALARLMREADLVVTDGMPLVWALRRFEGLRLERVTGPHLTLALCDEAAQQGLGVYLFGGSPDELEAMATSLRTRCPALRLVGQESPPLLPQQPAYDPALAARINASGAALVFVGLGCPKQEFWMQAHRPHLQAVCLGVGYAFALIGGLQKTAPQWMQRHGLEWLFRLVQEPRRLWRRYLIGNSLFVALCLRACLRPGRRRAS